MLDARRMTRAEALVLPCVLHLGRCVSHLAYKQIVPRPATKRGGEHQRAHDGVKGHARRYQGPRQGHHTRKVSSVPRNVQPVVGFYFGVVVVDSPVDSPVLLLLLLLLLVVVMAVVVE